MNFKNITEATVVYNDGKRFVHHQPQSSKGGPKPKPIETTGNDSFHNWLVDEINVYWPNAINCNVSGWRNKYTVKKARGDSNMELSFIEYLTIASEANITLLNVSCCGDSSTNYQLCRLDHNKPYTKDNCIFDTQEK